MGIIGLIAYDLEQFINELIGEERVHEIGGEFLGTPYEPDNPLFDVIDNVVHGSGLFRAWLWFDYQHKGKSMLEWFAEEKSDLPMDTMQRVRQLVEAQHFSLFRFGEVKPGSIECVDLRTGVHFRVREYSLASQVKKGQVCILRICQQNDHWEITMPDDSIMPFSLDDETMVEELVDSLPERLTMKDIPGYSSLLSSLGFEDKEGATSPMRLSKKDAFSELSAAMKEAKVDRHVSPERIADMLNSEYEAKEMPPFPPVGVRILLGLLDTDRPEHQERLMGTAMSYWNSLISDRKLKKAAKRSKKQAPDIVMHRFYPQAWMEHAQKADVAIANQDASQAVAIYSEMFAEMRRNQSVTASLYRLVANAGVSYLADGQLGIGRYLISKSLELCPDYDFALRQQEVIGEGHYELEKLRQEIGGDEEALLERFEPLQDLMPPPQSELRTYSDAKLLGLFAGRGAAQSREEIVAILQRSKTPLSACRALGAEEKSEDYMYGLIEEARERWTPKIVWTDTVSGYMWDLGYCIFEEGEPRETDIMAHAERLAGSLTRVSPEEYRKSVDEQFRDCVDQRQNMVYASLEVKRRFGIKAKSYSVLKEVCRQLYSLGGDPVFNVVEVIERVLQATEVKKRRQIISEQAAQLPTDHVSLQIIGEEISREHPAEAMYAYEKALSALELRKRKKLWDDLPYNIGPLSISYEYIAENLQELYSGAGEHKKSLDLEENVTEFLSDSHTATSPCQKRISEKVNQLITDGFKDSEVFQYIQWFETLGIDLSMGDGHKTNLTNHARLEKTGRNDPCPCGAERPNGKPQKYKNCHGKLA